MNRAAKGLLAAALVALSALPAFAQAAYLDHRLLVLGGAFFIACFPLFALAIYILLGLT